MKHGPIALIDEEVPVVVLAPKSSTYEKILRNIEEVTRPRRKSDCPGQPGRRGNCRQGQRCALDSGEPTICSCRSCSTSPSSFWRINIAVLKGTDVDQPRNLAKSVTVE